MIKTNEKLYDERKESGKICLPKQEIGQGMGWIAAFQDTEGNLMGLHEMRVLGKK